MNASLTILTPIVTVKDGAACADSRDIAAAFGKRHSHVLRKIDDLITGLPHLNGPNFGLVEYLDEKGERRRCYEMDRKGFSLVAMRFTGPEALAWQDAYTDAFDRMEAALHSGSASTGIDRADRSTFGGIVKSVTVKALTDNAPAIIRELLPDLLAAEMVGHHFQLVDRVSATEVSELAGYADGRRPRGLAQFVSRRLTRYHEDRGIPVRRSRHGIRRLKLFDESAARSWLRSGGKSEMDRYVAERNGQGRLGLGK